MDSNPTDYSTCTIKVVDNKICVRYLTWFWFLDVFVPGTWDIIVFLCLCLCLYTYTDLCEPSKAISSMKFQGVLLHDLFSGH